MIKARLVESGTGADFLTVDRNDGGFLPSIERRTGPQLLTSTYRATHGTFSTAYREAAGTTVLVAQRGNEGIRLSDIILCTDKVNGATVSLQIHDGTNTETLFTAHVTDAPCNLALSLGGRWYTWQGCHLDFVTVGTVKATISVGWHRTGALYTPAYAAWLALRTE